MTAGPVGWAHKPAAAPTAADLDERDRYARLTAASAETVRRSAQTWRNGLTAFITLVTTGVVIKGRDTTAGLAAGWRALVSVLIVGGLLLAVAARLPAHPRGESHSQMEGFQREGDRPRIPTLLYQLRRRY